MFILLCLMILFGVYISSSKTIDGKVKVGVILIEVLVLVLLIVFEAL